MGADLVVNSCCGTESDAMTSDMEKMKKVRQDKAVIIPSSDEEDIGNPDDNEYNDDGNKSDSDKK